MVGQQYAMLVLQCSSRAWFMRLRDTSK